MEKIELIILVGIPGSGKTTFFRRHLAGEYIHVSLDNWRGKGNVRGKEREAILAGLADVADGRTDKRGVAVDNTNTTAQTRRRYFELAAEFSARSGREVRLRAYFFEVDLEGCLARNAARPAGAPAGTPYLVPPEAISRFHAILQPPRLEEGFQQVVRVRIGPEGGFEVSAPPTDPPTELTDTQPGR